MPQFVQTDKNLKISDIHVLLRGSDESNMILLIGPNIGGREVNLTET
ncbi:2717_t:CDS:2, partial [Paraglomus brasilianum]